MKNFFSKSFIPTKYRNQTFERHRVSPQQVSTSPKTSQSQSRAATFTRASIQLDKHGGGATRAPCVYITLLLGASRPLIPHWRIKPVTSRPPQNPIDPLYPRKKKWKVKIQPTRVHACSSNFTGAWRSRALRVLQLRRSTRREERERADGVGRRARASPLVYSASRS